MGTHVHTHIHVNLYSDSSSLMKDNKIFIPTPSAFTSSQPTESIHSEASCWGLGHQREAKSGCSLVLVTPEVSRLLLCKTELCGMHATWRCAWVQRGHPSGCKVGPQAARDERSHSRLNLVTKRQQQSGQGWDSPEPDNDKKAHPVSAHWYHVTLLMSSQ